MLVSRGAKRLISSTAEDFYKLSAIALNGEQVNFSKYKGKVVLIQNTASLWGTTVRDFTQVINTYSTSLEWEHVPSGYYGKCDLYGINMIRINWH